MLLNSLDVILLTVLIGEMPFSYTLLMGEISYPSTLLTGEN